MLDIDNYIKENQQTNARTPINLNKADSHACLALLKLHQSRLLFSFIDAYVQKDARQFFFTYLSDAFSRGKQIIKFSNKCIFSLREIFPPVSWFYGTTEELPEPISFNCNKNRTEDDLTITKTVGKIIFEKLARNFPTYPKFAEFYNIPYNNVKNMLSRYRYEHNTVSQVRYKTFVTKSTVIAMRDVIHPDYWYIFPEELPQEDKAYKIIFDE